MGRLFLAFVLAPLTVPLVVGCLSMIAAVMGTTGNYFIDFRTAVLVTLISGCFSCAGTIVFGMRGYLWLCKRRIQAFWAWPAMGAAVGIVTGSILPLLGIWGLLYGPHTDISPKPIDVLIGTAIWLPLTGSLGTLVGIVHRLIAPPETPAEFADLGDTSPTV